jgi:multiple sugar transport system ATP-binding protein
MRRKFAPVSSVQIKDVRKSFGAVSISQGVSVDIADREFVVLVGPSGCGKSTLFLPSLGGGKETRLDRQALRDVDNRDGVVALKIQASSDMRAQL